MVTNGKLYTKVMEKLNFEPRLDASNITISIQGNHDVVILGGTVNTFAEKLIAENAVKSIRGVKAVAEEIKVSDSSSILYKRSDADIAEAATRALEWSVIIPEDSVKVVVEDGCLILSGEVEWRYQKDSAWTAVSTLWGIKSIINNIKINPRASIDESKVRQQITKEFERHARIDAGKVEIRIEGRNIILTGEVLNFEEMNVAVAAAWSVPGVVEVKNELTVGG